jgi:hypothetical protein
MPIISKFKKLLDVYSNLHIYQELSEAKKNLQDAYKEEKILKKIQAETNSDISIVKQDLNKKIGKL